MKRLLYALIFLLVIGSVSADKVTIFNFHYENGLLTLEDQLIKEGHFPDRKLQVEEGYSCSLVTKEGNDLHSLTFELPPVLTTEILIDGELDSEIIILNETDFSFIVPYFDASDEITCSNPRGFEILREDVEKFILAPETSRTKLLWIYGGIGIVLLVGIIWLNKRKNKAGQ